MVFNEFHSTRESAYELVRFIAAMVGSGAAVVMITVIYRMSSSINGYMKLVLTMVWYQLIYDLTFFTAGVDIGEYYVSYGSTMGQLIGGIGASVISNWISSIVLYIVVYQKPVDVLNYYDRILTSSIVMILPVIIVFSCGAIPEDTENNNYQGNNNNSNNRLQDIALDYMYKYFRLFSIVFNATILLFVIWCDYLSYCRHLSDEQIEMNTLSKQMIYYPIIQSLSYSGYAWYEFQYGNDLSLSSSEGDDNRYALLIYATLIAPLVSVVYLIILINIEPHAFEHFKTMMCCELTQIEAADKNTLHSNNVDSDNVRYEAMRSNMSVLVEAIEAVKDKMSTKLEEKDRIIADYHQYCSQLQQKCGNMFNEYKQLEQYIIKVKQEREMLKDVEHAKEVLQMKDINTQHVMIESELSKMIKNLNHQLEDLKNCNQQCIVELHDKKDSYDSIVIELRQEKDAKLGEKDEIISELNSKLSNALMEVERLTIYSTELQLQGNNIYNEYKSMEQYSIKMNEERDSIASELQQVSQILAQRSTSEKSLSDEMTILNQQLEQLRDTSTSSIQELSTRIQDYERTIISSNAVIDEREGEIRDLNARLMKAINDVEQLSTNNNQLQEQRSNMYNEYRNLEQYVVTLSKEKDELSREYMIANDVAQQKPKVERELTAEISAVKQQMEEATIESMQRINDLMIALDSCTKRMDEFVTEREALIRDRDIDVGALNARLSKADSDYEQLSANHLQLQQQRFLIDQEYRNLEHYVSTSNNEKATLAQELMIANQVVQQLRVVEKELSTKTLMLKEQLEQLKAGSQRREEELMERLQNAASDKEIFAAEKEVIRKEKDSVIEQLNTQLAAALMESQGVSSGLSEMQLLLTEKSSELKALKDHVVKITDEYDDLHKEVVTLRQVAVEKLLVDEELRKTSDVLQNTQHSVNELSSANSSYQENIQQLSMEKDALLQEVMRLKRENLEFNRRVSVKSSKS